MARPSKYTPVLARRIIELYSSGGNLQQIEKLKGVPSRRTILEWRSMFPEFGLAYDAALQANADALVEQCLQIADTVQDAKRAKNMIDIRTWIASKNYRARYGDKIEIESKVVIDIAPALNQAAARLQALGLSLPHKPIIEAKQLKAT